MSKNNVAAQNTLLEEMVKVKQLRFKEIESRKRPPRLSQRALQLKSNFEEFKAVYEDSLVRSSNVSPNREEYGVHKTKSGSLYRFPTIKKQPQYVETVNIELPVHFGGERAVQLIENKIKPKRASRTPKVNREVSTEHVDCKPPNKIQNITKKSKKTVTIMDHPVVIEDKLHIKPATPAAITKISDAQVKEIQKQFKSRKERIRKVLPKPLPVIRSTKEKNTSDKIMSTLSNINAKLQKMQEKYLSMPKVQYKNVNDCFTQSGNCEILFENDKYPKGMNFSEAAIKDDDVSKVSDCILSDCKMQERIKEMNELFPEFPKIEDTLKDIESHLDNIVEGANLSREGNLNEGITKMWDGGNLIDILDELNNKDTTKQCKVADEIAKKQRLVKDDKLRSIRQQIDEVEEFCDRLSQIANDEDSAKNISSEEAIVSEKNEQLCSEVFQTTQDPNLESKKPPAITNFIEGPDLRMSIMKSSYLSKEFGKLNGDAPKPIIKIFSENKRNCWRGSKNHIKDYSIESVTKMIDTLKFTLENSIYEPAAQ